MRRKSGKICKLLQTLPIILTPILKPARMQSGSGVSKQKSKPTQHAPISGHNSQVVSAPSQLPPAAVQSAARSWKQSPFSKQQAPFTTAHSGSRSTQAVSGSNREPGARQSVISVSLVHWAVDWLQQAPNTSPNVPIRQKLRSDCCSSCWQPLQIERSSPSGELIHRNQQSGSPRPRIEIQPSTKIHDSGSVTLYSFNSRPW